MRRLAVSIFVVSLSIAAAGCPRTAETTRNRTPVESPWFEDITDKVGLRFEHDAGPDSTGYFIPRVTGSGGAVIDYDGDGRLDVYLIHNGGPDGKKNQLFHREADGTFRDVSAGSGLDVAGYGQGCAVGDVDNDGLPDLVLTEFGRTRLFHNEGGGKFRDISREAGIENALWGLSAAFVDYDRDGWLDLIIGNYLAAEGEMRREVGSGSDFPVPSAFPGTVSRLFRNLGVSTGKGVRFEETTIKAGLGTARGKTMGIICADVNGDRWPDIIMANDMMANYVWINRKDGTFKDEALSRGLAYTAGGQAAANMGVGWGDVNGDGLPDLFVTHLIDETHTLWLQGPRGYFKDRTIGAGLTRSWRGTGFGTVLIDFNCDGWVDVALVNGGVHRQPGAPRTGPFWAGFAQRHQLFQNTGAGQFRDLSESNPVLCERPAVGRALIAADLDDDGAPDLITTEVAGPARVLRNIAPSRGHWLSVRALLPEQRRDAYGAELTMRAGDRTFVRLIYPGYSYCSSSDPRAHFGLGTLERYDEIRVAWPDGTHERFPGGSVDRQFTLRRGDGTMIKDSP